MKKCKSSSLKEKSLIIRISNNYKKYNKIYSK